MTARHATRVLAIAYGLFWLWSGVAKWKDPGAFAIAVRNFQLLADPFVAAAALFLPVLEVVCALAIIFRRAALGAQAVLWVSLVVLTAAIAVSWARGLDISCGCFGTGDGSTVNYPVKLAQNLALLAVGGWLLWQEWKSPVPTPSPTDSPAPPFRSNPV